MSDTYIDARGRKVFLEGMAAEFEALRADAKGWREDQLEREAWDVTIADGLDDE
jgi:hypothetical protein